MILKKWKELPVELQIPEVEKYYKNLQNKKIQLFLKRTFDLVISGIMLVLLAPFFLGLSIAIKAESPGPVFFRQTRITQYGQEFRIFKFRSMVQNADRIGTQVTLGNDSRITRVGRLIRKYRLDEISQLIDVFRGTMTFVGTRPEVPKYVEQYSASMMATLLLPAGVTSSASIRYKDEDQLLQSAENADEIYIRTILPDKMRYNLQDIWDFSLGNDWKIIFHTITAVFGKG